MQIEQIARRLKKVKSHIAETASNSGRDPDKIKLIAVTKTLPVECVKAAYDAGQRCFGESRVPDLAGKAPAMPEDCEWHMIGHLQRNKVKSALQYAALIHSVDSERLLERIEHVAAEQSCRVRILLQINISGEQSKYGIPAADALKLLETAIASEYIECRGLMTMAPFGAGEKELHLVFGGLRTLRDQLKYKCGAALPELSMGMSSDYEAAIQEGATLVRIGSAIFGTRQG